MTASRVVIGIAAAALAACGSPNRASTPRGSAAQKTVDSVISAALGATPATDAAKARYWAFVEQFPESRHDLLAKFGSPVAVTARPIRNEYDTTLVDTIVTLSYKGRAASYYVRRLDGGEFLTSVVVIDASLPLPLPVGIGSRRAALESAFGTPWNVGQHGGSTYVQFNVPDKDGTEYDQLVFTLIYGVVTEVEWRLGGE